MKRLSNMSARRLSAGFTLVEILIVVGIIAVIAGVVANNIFGGKDRSYVKLAQTQLQNLAGKIESYELDNGNPPAQLNDLISQPSGSTTWLGPYARAAELKDPWGTPIEYRVPGGNGKYDLISLGADEKSGGDGFDRDIVHEG